MKNRSLRATKLQFATKGEWENAIVVERGGDTNTLNTWLEDEQTAVEIFTSSVFFWGAKFEVISEEHRKLFEELVAGMNAGMTVKRSIEMIEQIAESRLFTGSPVFYEISMLDMWRPFGPVRFWQRGDERSPLRMLVDSTSGDKKFLRPTKLPLAIEYAYDIPIPHWIGKIVSTKREDGLWEYDPNEQKI